MSSVEISSFEILNTFEFSDDINIFHSYSIANGNEYIFSRKVINRNWFDSNISYQNNLIGYGEDPRAFSCNDVPMVYSVLHKDGYRQLNRLCLFNEEKSIWRWILLWHDKNIIPGKNWSPFVYRDEIYFVHEFSPFRVLKLNNRMNIHTDNVAYLEKVLEIELALPISKSDNYCVARGGSNGLELNDGIVMGFGHSNDLIDTADNATKLIHRPFVWKIDLRKVNVSIEGLKHNWDERFNIIDPTSFYKKGNKYYLITCETESDWWQNRPQKGRVCRYEILIKDS